MLWELISRLLATTEAKGTSKESEGREMNASEHSQALSRVVVWRRENLSHSKRYPGTFPKLVSQ